MLEAAAAAARRWRGGSQSQCVRQDGDWRQRRGMQQTHTKQNPKSMRREIAERHRGGKRGADDEDAAERLDQVADAARKRRSEESHARAAAAHEPELLGRQPARAQKTR